MGLERKRKRLDEGFTTSNIDGKDLSRLTKSVEKEEQEAQERMEHAEAELRATRATTVDVHQLVELARRVDTWAELSTEEVKQVLLDVIGSMTVYQPKVPTLAKKGNPIPSISFGNQG